MDEGVFRPAHSEEYVTIHCGYDYKFDSSQEALDFISDIIQNKEELDYFLGIVASHLVNKHQREEFFVLYNKKGNNGRY